MKAPVDKNEIRVRYSNGTYVARCQGKTASCTAGPKQAAEAVARKAMNRPVKVERIGGEDLWRLAER